MRIATVCVALAATAILGISSSSAQDCTCPGQLTDDFHDGDGKPLTWKYRTYVVDPGDATRKPLVCYYKVVENASDAEVLNIRWPIAQYYKRKIFSHQSLPSCPQLPGPMRDAPSQGDLHYGVASTPYETQVRERVPPSQAEAGTTIFPTIKSSFVYDTPDEDGNYKVAQVSIESYVQSTNDGNRLFFQLTNDSELGTSVVINMPYVESMVRELPFLKGVPLEAKTTSTFESFTTKDVSMQSAVVVFFDARQKSAMSIETLGLYAPISGEKIYSDDDLWKGIGSE